MKTLAKLSITACVGFLYFTALTLAQTQQAVPYPDGFRQWTHVKSELGGSGKPSRGLHNIYANPKAMDGFRTGHFTDGSIIVFDVLDIDTHTGSSAIGERLHVDVMHKDEKKFAKTGGWGFEEFRGNSRTQRDIGEDAAAKCFTCHAGQKDKGFVFSSFNE